MNQLGFCQVFNVTFGNLASSVMQTLPKHSFLFQQAECFTFRIVTFFRYLKGLTIVLCLTDGQEFFKTPLSPECSKRDSLSIKRPSHGKLVLKNFKKLANSFLHTSNSCQITNTVICNMTAFLVQSHSPTTVKQRKRREETKSGGEMEKSGRNQVCPRAPPFCFICFQYLCRLQMILNFKSVDSRPHFVKCHANKSREQSSF